MESKHITFSQKTGNKVLQPLVLKATSKTELQKFIFSLMIFPSEMLKSGTFTDLSVFRSF